MILIVNIPEGVYVCVLALGALNLFPLLLECGMRKMAKIVEGMGLRFARATVAQVDVMCDGLD